MINTACTIVANAVPDARSIAPNEAILSVSRVMISNYPIPPGVEGMELPILETHVVRIIIQLR